MSTITFDEIQVDLPGFLHRVESGESLLILQSDKPIAELRPISNPSQELRPFGLSKGAFTVPDDFNEPLPDDLLAEFEGV